MNLTETEKAYIAGFFDGEGCIQLGNNSKTSRATSTLAGVYLKIQIANNDKNVLEYIRVLVGGTLQKRAKHYRANWKQGYYLIICGKKAAAFLNEILPYLHTKKSQASAVIMFAETLYDPWRVLGVAGKPLTDKALKLRSIAFRGFRQEMEAQGGRKLSWSI